jgi:hypothetical protein
VIEKQYSISLLEWIHCFIVPFFVQQLIDNLDRDLQYAIQVEGKMDLDSVINYDEVKSDIKKQVCSLKMHVFQFSLTYKGACDF